jgi:D-alanine-D-alanine ligase
VLGNAPPRVLPVSEIDFAGLAPGMPHICGYEAKWRHADARYAATTGICPAALADPLRADIERWSALAFRVLGLRDYARIDWRLSPTRGLMALEANPNPDISPASGFLRSVRAAGMDYPEFIGLLIEETLARG